MPGGYHLRISLDVPTDNPPTTPSSFKQRAISSQGQIHVPKSLFDPLPAHTPKSTVRRNTFHDSRQTASVSHSSFDQQHRDYRFGPLTVEWIDFESMDSTNYSTGKKVGVGKEREGNTRGIFYSSLHFP